MLKQPRLNTNTPFYIYIQHTVKMFASLTNSVTKGVKSLSLSDSSNVRCAVPVGSLIAR